MRIASWVGNAISVFAVFSAMLTMGSSQSSAGERDPKAMGARYGQALGALEI